MKEQLYKVTREFLPGGIMEAGTTYTEITKVKMEVGFICAKPVAGKSPYKIIACEEIREK